MADLLLATKWFLLAASALIKTPIEAILPPCMRTRLVQVKYRASQAEHSVLKSRRRSNKTHPRY